ncbi:MAG: ribosome-associated heat shock protein [Candidatus Krumholzibacteriota bacterium]|jgi:ribosomal 50S subunit-recycling heat shock protein|nr:ribosome-associated heat shock protein [Candidatus Krumholzibacteriota bacterium]
MRVDLALKYLCLVKSRSSVKQLCDDGAVQVNDHPAKPSATLRPGDRIAIGYSHRTLTIELLLVPEKQLSKPLARTYYRTISDTGAGKGFDDEY